MKKYFNTSLLLATWLVTLPVWAMATSPDTLVDNTAQEVLAIVRQVAQTHGGEATAENADGGGALVLAAGYCLSELNALPERYRLLLYLCCIEGKPDVLAGPARPGKT